MLKLGMKNRLSGKYALLFFCMFLAISSWMPLQPLSAKAANNIQEETVINNEHFEKFRIAPESTGPVTFHERVKDTIGFLEKGFDLPESTSNLNNLTVARSGKPLAAADGDFNGDGSRDIVTAYSDGAQSYLTFREHDNNGKFSEVKVSDLSGVTPVAMRAADLNSDGYLDLAIINSNTNKISFVFGKGTGEFNRNIDFEVGSNPTSLAVTGKGLIVGDANGEFRVFSTLDVATAESKIFKAQAGIVAIDSADLNNDGKSDFAIATSNGVELWYGDAGESFKKQEVLPIDGPIAGLTLKGINLDSFPEVVSVTKNGIVAIWENEKGKHFTKSQTIKAANSAVGLKVDSVNIDKYTDIVVIDKDSSQLSVLLSKNGREFKSPAYVDVASNPIDVLIADMDTDARSDFLVVKEEGSSQAVGLTYNPNQTVDKGYTIYVTDLSGGRTIPVNGTVTDIRNKIKADGNGYLITFLDALTAANNTPEDQIIRFKVTNESAVQALDGGNYKEPQGVNNSLVHPNPLNPITPYVVQNNLNGSYTFNVNLIGASVNFPGSSLHILTTSGSGTGDGTVIDGENVGGLTQSVDPAELGTGKAQPGNANPNINKNGPDIRIIGDDEFATGFEIDAAKCKIQNLIISGFTKAGTQNNPEGFDNGAAAIEIGASNNSVLGCYIGPIDMFGFTNFKFDDPAEELPAAPVDLISHAKAGSRHGIHVMGSASIKVETNGTISTIISGNLDHGVLVEGGGTGTTNSFNNLLVGLLIDATTPLGNGFSPDRAGAAAGLQFNATPRGTPSNLVNNCLISSNGDDGDTITAPDIPGVLIGNINDGVGASGVKLTNNVIGLRRDGVNVPVRFGTTNLARNTGDGVRITNASFENEVSLNTISGNNGNGVLLDQLSTNNLVKGNNIGVNRDGDLSRGDTPNADRGNQIDGVRITQKAFANTIQNNTISNNLYNGISIFDGERIPRLNGHPSTQSNIIIGNKIGTNRNATILTRGTPLPNNQHGIELGKDSAGVDGNVRLNTIKENLIFFNQEDGIHFSGTNCDLNLVTQNSIVSNKGRGIGIVAVDGTREGPTTSEVVDVNNETFAQEKMTTTFDNAGTRVLPDIPSTEVGSPNQTAAAVTVDSALINGNQLRVTGRLGRKYDARARAFKIEIFASDPTSITNGGGQTKGVAQRYLGETTITSTVSPSTWEFTTSKDVRQGDYITATLTSPAGSTSEISTALRIDTGNIPGVANFSINRVTLNNGQDVVTQIGSTLDFGDVAVNSLADARVRLISNGTLGAQVTVNSITLTDGGGGVFTLSPVGGLPQTLSPTVDPKGSPGSFIDFLVTATPKKVGVQTGAITLNVVLNGPPVNSVLALRVNGTGQEISTNPANGGTLDFGSIEIGKTSAVQSVTITNTGSAPLSIGLNLSLSDFIYDAGFVAPTSIAPNGSVNVPLRFRPSNPPGTRTGTLTITHNGQSTSSPITINLRGVGTAPPPAPEPKVGVITIGGTVIGVGSQIDFGSVSVGSNKTLQLVVSNIGTANLVYSTAVVGEGFTGTVQGTTVAPGTNSTLNLVFTPPRAGSFTGGLVINTNAANFGTIGNIGLKGTGTASAISVDPGSLSFGSVVVNQPSTKSVTITNTGTAPLTITNVVLNGAAFQVKDVPSLPFLLDANASKTVQVTFTPTSATASTGTLTITSNAPNSPSVTVNLSGSGGDNISPVVTVTDPKFGDAFAAGTPMTVNFTATDNIGITSFDVLLAEDGQTFSSVVTGLPGTSNSATFTLRNGIEASRARVRVEAKDALGNVGRSDSAEFTIGLAPTIIDPIFNTTYKDIRMLIAGSNIQPGAVLIISKGVVPPTEIRLVTNKKNTRYRTETVSGETTIGKIVPKGTSVQLSVRNPNKVVGPIVTFTRPL